MPDRARVRLAATLGLALLATGPAPAALAAPKRAALPDSVVARMPHRDLTVTEMQASWARLDPRYRPSGEGVARARAFLDQLIEKEAMARAALAEPFTLTDRESAQIVALRRDLERQELFRMLVADSARINDADRDSARAHMEAMPDGSPTPPEAIDGAARTWAERRRGNELEQRVRAELAPAFDDSVAALVARAYAAADSALPNLDRPFSAAARDRRPRLAPGDSARVLVRSSAGDLTVGEFARRFMMLNPFQAPLPTTAGTVKARGEQFLGQMWFDAEVVRLGVSHRPGVVAALAERRESYALDHWYARHIAAAIDTSEAALRAHFAADAHPYDVPAHANITHALIGVEATADSLARALAAGAPWDSVCARLGGSERDREGCRSTVAIQDASPDTALVQRLRALAPGEAFVRPEPTAGGFRIIRLVERVPTRGRTFEEARAYVARDLAGRRAEALLVERMAALVKALPVTVNDAALARLTLGP